MKVKILASAVFAKTKRVPEKGASLVSLASKVDPWLTRTGALDSTVFFLPALSYLAIRIVDEGWHRVYGPPANLPVDLSFFAKALVPPC